MAKKVEITDVMPARDFRPTMIKKGNVSKFFGNLVFSIEFIDQNNCQYDTRIDINNIIKYGLLVDNGKANEIQSKINANDLKRVAYDTNSIALQLYTSQSLDDISDNIVKIYYAPDGISFTVSELLKCIEDFTARDPILQRYSGYDIYRNFGHGMTNYLHSEFNGTHSIFNKNTYTN